MKELIKKLSKVQKELVCKKNLYNSFGKYNYRNLESIFDSLKSHLANDVAVIIEEDLILIGDRYYVKATAIFTDGENKITASAFARESLSKKGQDDAMVTISTSSYASKSAMQKLFMLDDTSNTHEVDAQDNSQTSAIEKINKLINTKKVDKLEFLKYFKVNAVSELTFDGQQKAIQMLEKK
jgi:hypothetical protein